MTWQYTKTLLPKGEQLNSCFPLPNGECPRSDNGSRDASLVGCRGETPCPAEHSMTFGLPKVVLSYQYWQSRLERPRGLPPRTPAKRSTLDRNSLAVGQREQAFVLPPCGESVTAPFRQGRVVFFYAAIQIRFAGSWQHKKISTLCLDFILAFWLSAFSIFPFTAFTKCALIYQLTLVCALSEVFAKNRS